MRLLIVGTLKGQLTTATKIAMDKGATVTHAADIAQALAVLRSGRGADLLMVDVAIDIRDLVTGLEAEHIHVPIVACGIATDARAAVAAIHAGAKEYIPLPPDPELIAAVLAAVADDTRELIYRDDAMARVVKLAQQIAPSDASVLITGESGTGKEVLARYVHSALEPRARSRSSASTAPRSRKPARIRAVRPREGRLHRRGRAPHRQVRGGQRRHAAARRNLRDGRAAAGQAAARDPGARDRPRRRHPAGAGRHPHHRHLEPQSGRGGARGHVPRGSAVPPQRREPENPAAARAPGRRDRARASISSRNTPRRTACRRGRCRTKRARTLTLNRWPGNVRELENTMHRAVLLASGDEIGAGGDPRARRRAARSARSAPAVAHAALAAEQVTRALVGRTVAEVERDLILETLKHCLGNRTHAANILGISIRTLRNKLNEYAADGVPVPPPGGGEPRARPHSGGQIRNVRRLSPSSMTVRPRRRRCGGTRRPCCIRPK